MPSLTRFAASGILAGRSADPQTQTGAHIMADHDDTEKSDRTEDLAFLGWMAPSVARSDESFTAGEREVLESFLEWYRGTLLAKCAGLTGAALADQAVPPSKLSLIGLVRHMTNVERSWFRRRLNGEDVPHVHDGASPDPAFDAAAATTAEADYSTYLTELTLARAVAAGHGLDDTFLHERDQIQISLRWVYVHMIEEYARHCGHADLIRERIDGVTGN
jgi:uncharacterized damage-inducible protein DinB